MARIPTLTRSGGEGGMAGNCAPELPRGARGKRRCEASASTAGEKGNALPREAGPLFLIIDFHPDKRQALILARTLRSKGYPAARDIIVRDLEGSLAYARTCGIRYALILGQPGQREDSLILREIQSGKETPYGVARFCDRVMSGALSWPT